MSYNTARYILNRHGLAGFTLNELRQLLDDRFGVMPSEVKQAIKTLFTTPKQQRGGYYYAR